MEKRPPADQDKLAEDLRLKAQAVRGVTPDSVVTSHSAIPGIFSRPNWNGTPDDRKMADSVDYYGASIYPKHAWTIEPWSPYFRASGHDFTRSMTLTDDGFYIGELQAGYGVFGMKVSAPVLAGDLRDWMSLRSKSQMRITKTHAAIPFLGPGDLLDAVFFEESFEVFGEDSEVLAVFDNGQPALLHAPYGKGQALFVGSFVGSAYHHFDNPGNALFLTGLAHWLDVSKPVEVESSEENVLLEARVLEGEDFRILFGFNRGVKETEARFSVAVGGGDVAV